MEGSFLQKIFVRLWDGWNSERTTRNFFGENLNGWKLSFKGLATLYNHWTHHECILPIMYCRQKMSNSWSILGTFPVCPWIWSIYSPGLNSLITESLMIFIESLTSGSRNMTILFSTTFLCDAKPHWASLWHDANYPTDVPQTCIRKVTLKMPHSILEESEEHGWLSCAKPWILSAHIQHETSVTTLFTVLSLHQSHVIRSPDR